MFKETKKRISFVGNEIHKIKETYKNVLFKELNDDSNIANDKKERVKLYKLTVAASFFIFFVVLVIGSLLNLFLQALVIEIFFSLACLIFKKFPPKRIKYPTVFLMPPFSFACIFICIICMWVMTPLEPETKEIKKTEKQIEYEKKMNEQFDIKTIENLYNHLSLENNDYDYQGDVYGK